MTYEENNIFARILRNELPAHRVYETEHVLAFMDIMPRGVGHALVIPKAPSRNILDARPEDLGALFEAVQRVATASKSAFQADGVTIQQFNETAGGQVVFHLHVHVIPRFDGQPLRPPSGQMENPDVLAEHAAKLRAALSDLEAAKT
ncbi:MAG: HIT family protein [Microvirga sp.]